MIGRSYCLMFFTYLVLNILSYSITIADNVDDFSPGEGLIAAKADDIITTKEKLLSNEDALKFLSTIPMTHLKDIFKIVLPNLRRKRSVTDAQDKEVARGYFDSVKHTIRFGLNAIMRSVKSDPSILKLLRSVGVDSKILDYAFDKAAELVEAIYDFLTNNIIDSGFINYIITNYLKIFGINKDLAIVYQ